MKRIIGAALFIILISTVYGQDYTTKSGAEFSFKLNKREFISKLLSLNNKSIPNAAEISFPTPDGLFKSFYLYETPVLPSSLSEKYPEIRTYSGNGIANPSERLSITLYGVEPTIAMHLKSGNVVIEKADQNGTYTAMFEDSYSVREYDITPLPAETQLKSAVSSDCIGADEPCFSIGDTLYIYRIGMILSKEANAAAADGTVAGGLAWVANMVNRCNLVWTRDWGAKMVLADSSDKLICTTNNKGYFPSPPFQPPTYFLLDYIAPMLNDIIGANSYEYGHLVTTGVGGGWAGINSQKGVSNPSYEVIVHELGHQIGSPHNLTSESANNAWSIGGTIMGSRDKTVLTNDSLLNGDQYSSHTVDMAVYSQRQSGNKFQHGWKRESSGNRLPVVTQMPDSGLIIPIGTPFSLTGDASDADGDVLTFNWEQNDRARVSFTPPDFPDDNGPLFVSVFPSKIGQTRNFPNMNSLLAGRTSFYEQLPFSSRELNFRLIVRDNNPNCGSYVYKSVRLNSDAGSGPFKVLTGNDNDIFTAGTEEQIKWDVANTNSAPVNCSKVNILLSTNGGRSFDVLLAENTDNDGEEPVKFPDTPGSDNRLKIEAADNVFFDVNDKPFTLFDPQQSGLSVKFDNEVLRISGEDTASVVVSTRGLGTLSGDITVSVTDFPSGSSFSLNQSGTSVSVPATSEIRIAISGLSALGKGRHTASIRFMSGPIKKIKEIVILKIGEIYSIAGKCVSLKKSSLQQIVVPPLGEKIQNFSFTAWIRPEGIQNQYSAIFCSDGNTKAALNFKENNELGYHWEGGAWSWNSGLAAPSGTWSHVAMVVTASGITIYVNGKASVHAVDAGAANFIDYIRLGSYKNWSDRNYNGLLDEVAFWNKSLSEEEIRGIMHSTLSGDEEGLVSYFQFNAGNASDAISGNDGTLKAAPVFQKGSAPFGTAATSIRKEIKGIVNFEEAGLIVDYSTQNGSEVAVANIASSPNQFAGITETSIVLSEQYWAYHRYSSGGIYMGDFTFTVSDLHTGTNYSLPEDYILYNRSDNSDGNWEQVKSASKIDISRNQITFEKIYKTGQFIIARKDVSTSVVSEDQIPVEYALYQNYPNPFNPSTAISFDVPKSTYAKIEIYNVLGNLVNILVNRVVTAGHNTNYWDGLNAEGIKAASGIYIYRLITNEFQQTKKMMLLR